jgi:putative transposase
MDQLCGNFSGEKTTRMGNLVRHSLNYVGWQRRKEVARDLRSIYTAATAAAAEQSLEEFSLKWDAKFPMLAKSWGNNWERVIPFFAYLPEIRKVIYTTNAIELLNMSLRKVTKARGSFPHDAAVFKLLYLALHNFEKRWTKPVQHWKEALNLFAIIFADRLPDEALL